MSAKDLYDQLVSGLGYELTEKGFSGKGNYFYLRQNDHWGLISFQKSPKSTATDIQFTINLGIYSGTLSDFFTPSLSDKKPTLADCHWQKNLGDLLPSRQQHWWSVGKTQIQTLKAELTDHLLKLALPDITAHLDDKKLGAAWFTGAHPGITDFQRLLYLSVILKNIKRPNELMDVLAELEEKYTGTSVQTELEDHLNHIL